MSAYERGPSPELWGRTTLAEDIRIEESGQFSLIGCFLQGVIPVQGFPALLPKLAVFTEIVVNRELEKLPVEIRVYLPGDTEDAPTVSSTVVPGENILTTPDHDHDEQSLFPGGKVFRTVNITVSSPVKIPHAGVIQVRAFRGNKYYPIGSFVVEAAEQ